MNLALEAKSYKELKAIGKRYGLANVNLKTAKLIEKIKEAVSLSEPEKVAIESTKEGKAPRKNPINYRRLVKKLDIGLYKGINPIVHLLPDMQPPMEVEEEKSELLNSFLSEWDPWMQVYIELDGIMSTIDTEGSYASVVLIPVFEEVDNIENIVSGDDFMTFWTFFPTLSYIYALQYEKFLFLAIHYDLQEIFQISENVNPKIKLASNIEFAEKKELLWSVDSPEVLSYLIYGSTAFKDIFPSLDLPPWSEHFDTSFFSTRYRNKDSVDLTMKYVEHYISAASARLLSSILKIKVVVQDLKQNLPSQHNYLNLKNPLLEAIQWNDTSIKEKVITLLSYDLIKLEDIITPMIENHANELFVETFQGIQRSYWTRSNQEDLLATAIIAENVGIARILIAAGINTHILFEAKLTPKEPKQSFTPLLWAVAAGNPLLTQLLLEKDWEDHSDTASRSTAGLTSPLSWAVLNQDIFMVEMILRYTRVIDHPDSAGKTALDYAVDSGFDDIASLLRTHGQL